MARTLVARYRDAETARSVVASLLEAGFSGDDISLLVSETHRGSEAGNPPITMAECATVGAFVGALVGIGTTVMPEIEPVLGATPLALLGTLVIGAVVGALTGGISAHLLDVEPEKPHTTAPWLRANGTIVSLTTNEQWLEWAEKIMLRHQPLSIEGREAGWYGSAHARFNSDAAHDSGTFAALAGGSSSRMRQVRSSLSLPQRVKSYEYRN